MDLGESLRFDSTESHKSLQQRHQQQESPRNENSSMSLTMKVSSGSLRYESERLNNSPRVRKGLSASLHQQRSTPFTEQHHRKGLSASMHHYRPNSPRYRTGSTRRLSSRRHIVHSSQSSGLSRHSEHSQSKSSLESFGDDVRKHPESALHMTKMKSRGSILGNLTELPTAEDLDDPETRKHPKSIIRRFRLMCGNFVQAPFVQLSIIVLIIVNAILMGIATFDFVTENPDVLQAFETVDRVFLCIFTMELILQLVYRSLGLFLDGWLVFDFFVVVISWSLESLQIVRAFRIFRAFRLITRVGPLKELIMALGTVMPRIYAIAMLLLLIFYIYGVLFTELFGDLQLEANYFGSLDVSLFTCMELMTLEWASVAREVMEQISWAWVIFLSFISITGFIVFNLIVAVVCDAVSVVDQQMRSSKGEEEETDLSKLQQAQERIWELTEIIEDLNMRQQDMSCLVSTLASSFQMPTPSPKSILKNGLAPTPDTVPISDADHDMLMASFSAASYESFFGDSQNISTRSASSVEEELKVNGPSQISQKSVNEKEPKNERINSAETPSNHTTDQHSEQEATRRALISRGYLRPHSSLSPKQSSISTSDGEAPSNKEIRAVKSPPSLPDRPPSRQGPKDLPMRSLFSP